MTQQTGNHVHNWKRQGDTPPPGKIWEYCTGCHERRERDEK